MPSPDAAKLKSIRPQAHLEETPSRKMQVRILETSLRLFNALGPEAVSIRRIAQAARIGYSLISYHFPSGKADIIDELWTWCSYEIITLSRMREYKFFFLSPIQIARDFPKMRGRYTSHMLILALTLQKEELAVLVGPPQNTLSSPALSG